MSDMKCPICQTVLDKAFLSDKVRGCPKCKNIGNIDLWQELIRTRKALDAANAVIMNYAKEKLEKKESAFVHNKIEFPEYNDNLLEEFDKQFFENGQDDDLTETETEKVSKKEIK